MDTYDPPFSAIPRHGAYPVEATYRCVQCMDMDRILPEYTRQFVCVVHGLCLWYLAYESVEYTKRLVSGGI